jgi:2-(1,2-epoxy-1,2-dihydrophenyl)acetyl-CoA isomerase
MDRQAEPADGVTVADHAGVRWITLHRPESKNGLTAGSNAAIIAALASAADDAHERRVVVLHGAGGAFSSGLDLRAAAAVGQTSSVDNETRMRAHFHGLIRALVACPLPVIAAVDGPAVGFGCDLALACDLRFCSARARFGEIFVKRGLMPDGGGTFLLPRLVGLGRALELMLSGDLVDADEALRIGLANRVVPEGGFEAAARAYAAKLAEGAPLVLRAVKAATYAALASGLDAALETELRGQMRLLHSADFAEGLAAFLGKRPPRFTGA